MKLIKIALLALALVDLFVVGAAGQEPPPPGLINMLPGYHHRVGQGIDSKIGIIWKKNGIQIHYDIGELAGNYAECGRLCGWTNGSLWRRDQIVNGQKVVCVFTSKKRLVVSFPSAHANFYATVRTQNELTDMLLMVFTFQAPSRKVNSLRSEVP